MKPLLTFILILIFSNCFSQKIIISIEVEKKEIIELNNRIEKFEKKCFSDTNYVNTTNYNLELSQLGYGGEPEYATGIPQPSVIKNLIFYTALYRVQFLNFYLKFKNYDETYKAGYEKFKEIYNILYSKFMSLE